MLFGKFLALQDTDSNSINNMIIDFNKLNLQEAKLKRFSTLAPAGMQHAWPHALDCGHAHLFTASQISDPNMKDGEKVYCSKCADGDHSGTAGEHRFCTRTVYHKPVVIGDPVFVPLE